MLSEKKLIKYVYGCNSYGKTIDPFIIKKLVDEGHDINEKDDTGDTALIHTSRSFGRIESVKTLVKFGANINIQNEKGDTAIAIACKYKHTDIFDFLLKQGAKLDIQNIDGYTLLTEACFCCNPDIVKKIIQYGANINHQTIFGNTALHNAVINKNYPVEIVDILLNAGIDVNIKNRDGNTALDIAKKSYDKDKNETDAKIIEIIENFQLDKQTSKLDNYQFSM